MFEARHGFGKIKGKQTPYDGHVATSDNRIESPNCNYLNQHTTYYSTPDRLSIHNYL